MDEQKQERELNNDHSTDSQNVTNDLDNKEKGSTPSLMANSTIEKKKSNRNSSLEQKEEENHKKKGRVQFMSNENEAKKH